MRIHFAALAAAGVAALSACSSGPRGDVRGPVVVAPARAGAELVGQSLRVETSAGRTSVMQFAADGTVRATFSGRETAGRWEVEGQKLCFTWGSVRDCWPYVAPLTRGQTVALTSDRGNKVRVTLL